MLFITISYSLPLPPLCRPQTSARTRLGSRTCPASRIIVIWEKYGIIIAILQIILFIEYFQIVGNIIIDRAYYSYAIHYSCHHVLHLPAVL